jgi:glutamate racemase
MMRTPADPEAPIGVFDSGIGGLTVLRAIRQLMPSESTVYFGDTARVPYGPKSPQTILRYSLEASDFLLGQGVKMIVVACNTATAHALSSVADYAPVPVVGVVEPGATQAARQSTSGRIGVIGTQGTIESGAYESAIRAVRPEATVFGVACPLFVALAEEGWTEGEVARLTAERYLTPLLDRDIDTMVLGCTHYPLLESLLAEVVGTGIDLIDSARATADAVAERLRRSDMAAPEGEAVARYYASDDAARFDELAGRFLGATVPHLERVSVDTTD